MLEASTMQMLFRLSFLPLHQPHQLLILLLSSRYLLRHLDTIMHMHVLILILLLPYVPNKQADIYGTQYCSTQPASYYAAVDDEIGATCMRATFFRCHELFSPAVCGPSPGTCVSGTTY